ncbi:peroxisomal membrane protein 11A-like [Ciona intestinalis]
MDFFIEYTSKTTGRDKLYRVTQYACKVIGWSLKNSSSYEDVVAKLAKVESHSSTTRKFFRLGRSLESLRNAQKTVHLADPVLRTTLTIAHLNRALFLAIDHYLWLGRVGVVKVDKKWDLSASRYYLASIIITLVRDLYAIYVGMERSKREGKRYSFLARLCYADPAATVDLVRNICDYPIPASKLGFFPKHDGLIGVLGLISSILGAYQFANPKYKPKP